MVRRSLMEHKIRLHNLGAFQPHQQKETAIEEVWRKYFVSRSCWIAPLALQSIKLQNTNVNLVYLIELPVKKSYVICLRLKTSVFCILLFVLTLHPRTWNVAVSLESYGDADFAKYIDGRFSILGYAFFLTEGPICWHSRSQYTVALSTMEDRNMRQRLYTGGPLVKISVGRDGT